VTGDDVKWRASVERGDHITTAADLNDAIDRIYKHGGDEGETTGWKELDRKYRVKKGELVILGGHGSHGKSGWLDALLCNLAHSHNWRFLMFSAENYPYEDHMRKLIEIRAGVALRKRVGKEWTVMPPDEYARSKRWVGEHFDWVDIRGADTTVPNLLDVYSSRVKKYDGFVLDPWNEVQHKRGGESETDYISSCLSLYRKFARKSGVCFWVVTHPAKTQRNRDGSFPVLSLTDLHGSYSWRAKADIGIICHREDMSKDGMKLYVQKVRRKTLGKVGNVVFDYDFDSGRFIVGGEHGMEEEKGYSAQIEVPF